MRLIPPPKAAFVWLVIGAISAAVIAGLVVLGSPGEARVRRLDARRVADLQGITRATRVYQDRHGRLPASLDELPQESGMPVDSRDPATAEPYRYRMVDSVTYELCARFERASSSDSDLEPLWGGDGSWSHGAGWQCFQRDARASLHR